MKNLELLSPAGNIDNLKVAVNNGADAVYLGLQSFNARNKAGNFDESNIKEVVSYCHLRGVKVYLTVNTIIKNEEVNALLDMIKIAVNAKVDAYIVQDLGVAYLLKHHFKNIVLHSSTQLGVHNKMGAQVLKDYGFSRVVLSRETKLNDIKEIASLGLEIEYFVQGALCVAFSGNCYMSSLCNGESGNRGRCLQLCRLKYQSLLNDKPLKKGYLLSPTDLCLIDRLQELSEAGVTSLKIEGRMRRAGFVAAATREYRSAIDELKYNKDSLVKAFYRGRYNEGYYLTDENKHKIINPEYQNHRGVEIGKVLKVKPFKNLYDITIISSHSLVQNDGLKFVSSKGELSLGVGSVKKLRDNIYSLITTAKPNIDDKVYLTVDKVWEDELTSRMAKLKIDMSFIGKVGEKPKLTLKYNNTEATVLGDNDINRAQNAPLSENSIRDSLSKLGDSDFELDKFSCDIQDIFMPKSELNALRRKGIDVITEAILQDYELEYIRDVVYSDIQDNPIKSQKVKLSIVNERVKDIPEGDLVWAPFDYNDIKAAQDIRAQARGRLYLNLPIILRERDKDVLDNILNKVAFDGVVVNNIYGLAINAKEKIAGTGLNIANDYTVRFLNAHGITKYIKSIESHLSQDLGGGNTYEGRVPLMTFCHCPYMVNFGCTCKTCSYKDNLSYKMDNGKTMDIRRYRLAGCYFELVSQNTYGKDGDVIDLR